MWTSRRCDWPSYNPICRGTSMAARPKVSAIPLPSDQASLYASTAAIKNILDSLGLAGASSAEQALGLKDYLKKIGDGSVAGIPYGLYNGHLALLGNASFPQPLLTWVHQVAQGGFAAGQPEGWHEIGATSEPAFTNSWVNVGGGEPTAAFQKTATGIVLLKGMIKSGTLAASAFTLPVGYRPSQQVEFVGAASGPVIARAAVGAAGTVSPCLQGGNNTFATIHCSFLAGG